MDNKQIARLRIIHSLLDLIGVFSFVLALCLTFVMIQNNQTRKEEEKQFKIYERFVVLCLNGNWIINGKEGVKCFPF